MAFANGYTYQKLVTQPHTLVSGGADLTSFPVLVSVTDTDLKTVANGGFVQSSTGLDIRFETTGGVKLDHEVEQWSATTGLFIAWVRIPTLGYAADTTFYMYFGNSSVVASEQNKTGVWDANHAAVYHLPDGTTLSGADSTSNASNLTATGAPTAQTGKIDGGVGTSSGNYLSGTISAIGTVNTVSAWVKFNTFSVQQFVITAADGAEVLSGDASGAKNAVNAIYGSAWAFGTTFVAGSWYYVTNVRNGTATNGYQSYVNGVLDITTTRPSADSGSSVKLGVSQGLLRPLDGTIDEARVSTVARSAGWIVTDYNAQSSPSTFLTYGTKATAATNGGSAIGIATATAAAVLLGIGAATGISNATASGSDVGAASAVGVATATASAVVFGAGNATGGATASASGQLIGYSAATGIATASAAGQPQGASSATGIANATASGQDLGAGSAVGIANATALAAGSGNGGAATGVANATAAGIDLGAAIATGIANASATAIEIGAGSATGTANASATGQTIGGGAATGIASASASPTAAGSASAVGVANASAGAQDLGSASATGVANATASGVVFGAGSATGVAVASASTGQYQHSATTVARPLHSATTVARPLHSATTLAD